MCNPDGHLGFAYFYVLGDWLSLCLETLEVVVLFVCFLGRMGRRVWKFVDICMWHQLVNV